MTNDTNWANATLVVIDPDEVCLEPVSPETLTQRRKQREILTSGTALTAVLFAVLAILKA